MTALYKWHKLSDESDKKDGNVSNLKKLRLRQRLHVAFKVKATIHQLTMSICIRACAFSIEMLLSDYRSHMLLIRQRNVAVKLFMSFSFRSSPTFSFERHNIHNDAVLISIRGVYVCHCSTYCRAIKYASHTHMCFYAHHIEEYSPYATEYRNFKVHKSGIMARKERSKEHNSDCFNNNNSQQQQH